MPDDRSDRPARDPNPGLVPLLLAAVAAAGLGGYAWVQVQRQDRARAEEQLARAEAEAAAAEAAERAADRRREPPGPAGGLAAFLPLSVTPADAGPVRDRLAKELVGVWAGGGREVEYRADGTFRDGPLAGTWKPAGLTGTKVLTVERAGGGPARVRVTFEGGELLHGGGEPGTVDVLRRKS